MSNKQIKRIHLIYSIVISLLILALGIWAIASCIMLYKGGEAGARFTLDKIMPHIYAFLVPLTVTIAVIIIGIVLNAVFHVDEPKPQAFVSDKDLLKKLYEKLNLEEAPKELSGVVRSQRGFRRTFYIVMLVNIAINAFSAIYYLFTNPVLKEQLENLVKANESLPKGAFWDLSISTAPKIDVFFPIMCTTLLYIAIPFIVAIAYDIFAKFTYEKELEAVKAIYAYYAKKGIPVSKNDEENEADAPAEEGSSVLFDLKNNWVKIFKYSVLVLSVLLIVFGIVSGNLEAILNNAIKICTGCIGLE